MSKQTFHFLVAVEATDSVAADAIINERISYDEVYDFPGGDDYNLGYTSEPEVYVVLAEDGDVVDVTASGEWAAHLTRDDEDTPFRVSVPAILWDGPANRSEW